MEVDESLVSYILTTYYNMRPIVGSLSQLCGYSDKNYSFVDSTNSENKKYVLKIVNKDESDPNLTAIIDETLDNAYEFCTTDQSRLLFLVPRLIRTTGNKLSTFTSVKHPQHRDVSSSLDNNNELPDYEFVPCNLRLCEHFDGITMLDLINRHLPKYKPEELYCKLGRMANQLFRFFRTQGHLLARLRSVRKGFSWQLIGSDEIVEQNLTRLYPDPGHARRLLVESVLSDYETIRSEVSNLPEFIFHSDLCNRNILIDHNQSVSSDANKMCLIDFQDIQVGPQVAELAILMLYNILEQEQIPFDKALKQIPKWILLGYQSSGIESLPLDQVKFIPILMKLRLIQSLLNGQVACEENPSKVDYVMHTNQRGWQLLELMTSESDKNLEKQLACLCKSC